MVYKVDIYGLQPPNILAPTLQKFSCTSGFTCNTMDIQNNELGLACCRDNLFVTYNQLFVHSYHNIAICNKFP